jgi:hypothetical protein
VRCYIDPNKLSPSQSGNGRKLQSWIYSQCRPSASTLLYGAWVAQESAPTLPRRVIFPDHVLGDGQLHHHEAKLEQFAMNARPAPKTVLNAYASDHIALKKAISVD